MQLMPLDSIITTNTYLRTDTNIDKLKKSIETVGLINPLVINKKNELIAGGRRFTALKALGYTDVPVFQVDKSEKEQELISIDENLVRKDLTKIELEKCLNRGKEIYEELYPQAKKVAEEDLETPEGQDIQTDLPNEERSFIDITAEKTGLSKKVIKSAIDRDELSSKKVKSLRANGELNATQANELIKLDKEEQDQIVDMVCDKSGKDIKNLVKSIKEIGVEGAIDEALSAPQLPKEYKGIQTLAKRLNKLAAKAILEEMICEHEDMTKIKKDLTTLRSHIDQMLDLHSGNRSVAYDEANDTENDTEDANHIDPSNFAGENEMDNQGVESNF